jgi:hypothetical protein
MICPYDLPELFGFFSNQSNHLRKSDRSGNNNNNNINKKQTKSNHDINNELSRKNNKNLPPQIMQRRNAEIPFIDLTDDDSDDDMPYQYQRRRDILYDLQA